MDYRLKFVLFLSIFCATFKVSYSQEIAYYEKVRDIIYHPEKLLIDVREPWELEATGQYPTGINIQMTKLEWAFKLSPEEFKRTYNHTKPNFSDPIIFACKKGIRAERAALLIYSMGYTNVKYYKGSWEEWCILEKVKCYDDAEKKINVVTV